MYVIVCVCRMTTSCLSNSDDLPTNLCLIANNPLRTSNGFFHKFSGDL